MNDYSIPLHENQTKKYKKYLRYLEAFENPNMSPHQKESYDVMKYFVNLSVKRDFNPRFNYHNYLINQMMGAQSEIISFITKFHRILNLKDAEAYLLRVKKSILFHYSFNVFSFVKGAKNIKSFRSTY